MDAVLLARIQFALTIGFHFIFPPISIGLAWLIVLLFRRHRRSGDALYLRMARFWTSLLALTFAVGVATGITMEFQFGTNWEQYSRFVGDIFGAPLAAEAIFSFFLESTFMGVLVFGWRRFSTRTLSFAALMVAIGATISAFWIIVANSWMQTPAGFHLVNGRAELTSFFDAVFNASTVPRFLHTIGAAMITGSFFMLGISAWMVIKKPQDEFARASLRSALIVATVSAVLQLPLGHAHAVQVVRTQPEKLAAMEGLFAGETGAALLLFGIPDADARTVHAAIRVPYALSLMAYADPHAPIPGLNDFPREEWPPVALTFWSFHAMVDLGMLFIGFTLLGVFLLYRCRLYDTRWWLRAAVLIAPLPIVANELGWIAAEVGRQPWIVYHVMKTRDAVSTVVPAEQILASIIMFSLVYSLLLALWLFILGRKVAAGPLPDEPGVIPPATGVTP
jgi:cytochrome bd ubiquinol oxidase subunit I